MARMSIRELEVSLAVWSGRLDAWTLALRFMGAGHANASRIADRISHAETAIAQVRAELKFAREVADESPGMAQCDGCAEYEPYESLARRDGRVYCELCASGR